MSLAKQMIRELKTNHPTSTELEPAFHQLVVDHFPYLRANPDLTPPFTVDGLTGAIYKGDFHGLLQAQKIDSRYHTLLTEFNGFLKSLDYDGSAGTFFKIETSFIDKLKKTYVSKRR